MIHAGAMNTTEEMGHYKKPFPNVSILLKLHMNNTGSSFSTQLYPASLAT